VRLVLRGGGDDASLSDSLLLLLLLDFVRLIEVSGVALVRRGQSCLKIL
jgi:hypothetical protein